MRISTQRFIVPLLVSFSLTGAAVLLLYFLNKKKNEDDFKVKNKKSEELSVVMKIPRQLVPAVIGRAGSTIAMIQLHTKTKIIFNSEDDMNLPDRTCIITGKLEDIKLAKEKIDCVLNNQPIIETYETWVPQITISKILERGGQLLSQIQNSSNAKIILDSSINLSNSDLDSKKRVILKGTAEQIADALLQIEDKIKEDKEIRLKTDNSSYNRVPRIKTPPAIASQNDSKTAKYAKEVFGKLTNEGLMEVFVSAVESPNKFFIQVCGPSFIELDDLIQEMSTYYELQENKELHTLKNISVGQMVTTTMYDNMWYRGEIVADLDNNMYDVYFVDFGDHKEVNGSNIFELRTDFLSLRLQAIECSLAGVKPWDNEWSKEAIDAFNGLVQDMQDKCHMCTAKIRGYRERIAAVGLSRREGSPIPCVDLYWKSGNQVLMNAAEELLARGELARPDSEPRSTASSTLSLAHQSATSPARSPENPQDDAHGDAPRRTVVTPPPQPQPQFTAGTGKTTTGTRALRGNGYEEIDLTESPKPKNPRPIEVIDLTTSPPADPSVRNAATESLLASERGAGGDARTTPANGGFVNFNAGSVLEGGGGGVNFKAGSRASQGGSGGNDGFRNFNAGSRASGGGSRVNSSVSDKPRSRPANPFATQTSGGRGGLGAATTQRKNIIPAGFESDESGGSDEFEIY